MVDVMKYQTNTLPYGTTPEERKAFREEDRRLIALFEHDLAEENGMLEHPKRYLLWSKAWDQGHSSDLDSVVFWYEDLLELVE